MSLRPNTNKETIIFLHIPKTAGTTLDQIIFRHYRRKKIYETGRMSQRGVQNYIQMNEAQRARFRLIKGHLNFGIHHHVPPPWAYFTFLRDPIDRTISHYYFISQNDEHVLYDRIQEENLNLKDYLQAGLDPMLFNAQTRLLSGVWDKKPAGTCTAEHLKMAKENLKNHIKVFGLTERFDESLLLLKKAFGWHIMAYARLNVTNRRPKTDRLDPALLTAVENANQLDLELYQFALPLFEQQINNFGPDFEKALKEFHLQNKILSPFSKLMWEIRKISIRVFFQQQLARLSKN